MVHFFEQINHILEDAEFAGILIVILIASLIILNVTLCICAISARKSLKRIADHLSPKPRAATYKRLDKDMKTLKKDLAKVKEGSDPSPTHH